MDAAANDAVRSGDRARRNTISDAFRRSALRHANRHALTFADRHWTFGDLERAVNRVAAAIVDVGFKPGERVAAYGRNSDAYILFWLACTRVGLVHVPVNYALTGRELNYIVDQSGASALIVDPKLEEKAIEAIGSERQIRMIGTFYGGTGFDVLDAALNGKDVPLVDNPVDDTDVAQLLYTSGTTAAPKGAMMTHRGLIAEYFSCIYELGFSGADKALAALPLYHSAQMHVFTIPQFLVGASTILIEAPQP